MEYTVEQDGDGCLLSVCLNTRNTEQGCLRNLEGIITLPITILGYTFWPGLPSSPKRWYFTEEEHALAVKRIPHVEDEGITWKTFKYTISRPMWWIAVPCYM